MGDPPNPKNADHLTIYNNRDGRANNEIDNNVNQTIKTKQYSDPDRGSPSPTLLFPTSADRRRVCVSEGNKPDESIINTGRISDERGEAFIGRDLMNMTLGPINFAKKISHFLDDPAGQESSFWDVLKLENQVLFSRLNNQDIDIFKSFRNGKYFFSFGGNKSGIKYTFDCNDSTLGIQYNATALMGCNLFALHAKQIESLRLLGISQKDTKQERIQRLDFHVTFDEPIQNIIDLIDRGHADTLITRVSMFGHGIAASDRQIDTITFGDPHNAQISIYNKRKQLSTLKSNDEYKYNKNIEMIGNDWLYSDKPITRVEGRLYSEKLKELGISSVSSLQENERKLIQYLTGELFRLTLSPKKPVFNLIISDAASKMKFTTLKKFQKHGQAVFNQIMQDVQKLIPNKRGRKSDRVIHPTWERITALFYMILQEQEQQ
jgi:hypothetical protein